LNFITAKRHYHYHGITASCLPSPRYYREIFPVPAVITVVTAALLLFPLPCHPLSCTSVPHRSQCPKQYDTLSATPALWPNLTVVYNVYTLQTRHLDAYNNNICVPLLTETRLCSSGRRNLLHVPRHRLSTYGQRVFAVAGLLAWNCLANPVCRLNATKATVMFALY